MTEPLLAAAIAAAGAVVLTPATATAGRALGLVDRPDGTELKIHAAAVPVTGGVAIVVSVMIAARLSGSAPPLGLTLGALLGLALGLRDDVSALAPSLWIAALAAIGLLLAVTGGGSFGIAVVTVAATIGIPNGVNLIDGQDGLAGAVASAAAAGLAIALWRAGDTAGVTAAALAGALLGFLVWNRPPARVFLGNGGAYAVGVLLAWSTVRLVAIEGWAGAAAAALCLTVIGADVATTVLRRWAARRPIAAGDRDHLYDRVAARHGRAGSLGLFAAASIVTAASGVLVAVKG